MVPSIFDIVIPVKRKLFQYGTGYWRDLFSSNLFAYQNPQNGIPIIESTKFFPKPLVHKIKPLVVYRLNVPEQFNNLRALGKLIER